MNNLRGRKAATARPIRLRMRFTQWRWGFQAWRWRLKDRARRIWRGWVTRHQRKSRLLAWLVVSLAAAFGLLALADPHAQTPCRWGIGWFGCVLANHEGLAGACFT